MSPPRSEPDPALVPVSDDVAAPEPGGTVADGTAPEAPRLVDFRRTARRLRAALLVIGVLVAVAWAVTAVVGEPSLRRLFELAGLGLLAAFVVEVVVVGGSAVRGMLAAGARGDRLAAGDVSLLPPQLGRRRR